MPRTKQTSRKSTGGTVPRAAFAINNPSNADCEGADDNEGATIGSVDDHAVVAIGPADDNIVSSDEVRSVNNHAANDDHEVRVSMRVLFC